MKKTREELIVIYQHTKDHIDKGGGNVFSTYTKYNYLENSPIRGEIVVVDQDSVSCLIEEEQSKLGFEHICVLNMASAKRPGGGVEKGEPTQEECLYRCSNLSEYANEILYPLKDGEFIYYENIVFFKDANYRLLDDHNQVICDVISFPAINLNKNSYFDKEKDEWVDGIVEQPHDYEVQLKKKIRALFRAATYNDVDILILGAWGCGVFKNHPTDIAYAFRDVLIDEGYINRFKKVVFPIINDENSTANNYYYFEKILGNL